MATTRFPCPACYQAQTVQHQNGEEVPVTLCASCQEEADGLGLSQAEYAKEAHKLRARAEEARRT
jgi:Zn ribbon nucleic-acid-binding protein